MGRSVTGKSPNRIRRGSTAVLENDIGIRMDELIEFVLREFDKGEDFYFIRP